MNLFDRKAAPWDIDERNFPATRPLGDRLRFLLRFAILAPSSHNTQPWNFSIRDNRIDVFADDSRWLRVADADQRELHISVGCALENLLVAAEHFELGYVTEYVPKSDDLLHVASVIFSEARVATHDRPAVLFDMVTVRHTNHRQYDNRPIPQDALDKLLGCCVEDGVSVLLATDEDIKRKVAELVVQADAIEFSDPGFRKELGYWIGQGVFGTSWLTAKIGQFAVSHLNIGKAQSTKFGFRTIRRPAPRCFAGFG